MNVLVALMLIGGGIAFAFALVSILDKKEKRRLLRQAESAAGGFYTEKKERPHETLGDPDQAWWGNGCVVLLYVDAALIVTAMADSTQVLPSATILECSCMTSMNNGGTSKLMFSLNDPKNPEVNLDFPGDSAVHAQRAIGALIAEVQSQPPPPPLVVVGQEGEYEQEEPFYDEHIIDTTPRHQNIIMDLPHPERDRGKTVIIDG